MIRRLLIANRGEIAIRILRACRELGIEAVAVYSDVDAGARHVRAAARAEPIGGAAAADSYLSIPAILEAARRSGADAVHPGYGFLSENAEFARACDAAGLVFVGPPADAMEKFGSKIAARALMTSAGVPIVPGGVPADQSDAGVQAVARQLGLPLLLKASAGGGGKGMRMIRTEDELLPSIQSARREAAASFGDGTLYVEQLIERARHIEFQVFGDRHGCIVHLFERECSIQRRHQKIIEETPSPAVSPALRARMGEAAVEAARAGGYRNAGTVEFLVEGGGDGARFYFLEVNARLQVEHAITEAVTGVDLVRAQLQVASGEHLPWKQDDLRQRGHAIECRLYAEDPAADFLPQAGRLLLYREPSGPGIRIDSGVCEGDMVPVHYDPLLAKLTAYDDNRTRVISRVVAALRSYPVLGIRTNLAYLIRVLEHPRFGAGDVDTAFVDAVHQDLIDQDVDVPPEALATAVVHDLAARRGTSAGPESQSCGADPWRTLIGWRQLS